MSTATLAFDELTRICAENAGALTPKAVVAASRPADAPLHDRFEWDDAIAGDSYREIVAAQIIRSVHITRTTDERGPTRVRAFLCVGEESAAWTYTPIDNLTSDATAAILAQMERDVASLRRKYRDHKAAFGDLLKRIFIDDKRETA